MALAVEQGSDNNKKSCKILISEEMTIYCINELKLSLSEFLDIYEVFEFDLSAVEEIDTSGIQLLLAFNTEVLSKKKQLAISAMSGPVEKLFNTYEIKDHFTIGALL